MRDQAKGHKLSTLEVFSTLRKADGPINIAFQQSALAMIHIQRRAWPHGVFVVIIISFAKYYGFKELNPFSAF